LDRLVLRERRANVVLGFSLRRQQALRLAGEVLGFG